MKETLKPFVRPAGPEPKTEPAQPQQIQTEIQIGSLRKKSNDYIIESINEGNPVLLTLSSGKQVVLVDKTEYEKLKAK